MIRELFSKLKSADRALLLVASAFGVIGVAALIFPSVSIRAQPKQWLTDTTFSGGEAAGFGLLSLTIAYAIGRLAFHQGRNIIWKVELPILSAIYGGAFVLHQLCNGS